MRVILNINLSNALFFMMSQIPLNVHAYRDQLYEKHESAGNEATTKESWYKNIKLDTYATHLGNPSQLIYFSCKLNKTVQQLRNQFIDEMFEILCQKNIEPVNDSDLENGAE